MTVNAGAAHHIVISPDSATITAGTPKTYTAEAFDEWNNSLGLVTDNTTFSIDAGAGGSWAANAYTSATAGNLDRHRHLRRALRHSHPCCERRTS